jgi:hypothetical protein
MKCRSQRRWAAGGLAAAAAVLLLVGGLRLLGPRGEGRDRKVAASPRVTASARKLHTDEKPRQVRLGRHRMTLAPHGQIRLLRVTTREVRVVLDRGSASFDVAPLEGGSFRVDTPHARVVVRGTRFTVRVRERRPCTDVSVARGLVRASALGGQEVALRRGHSRTLCLPSNQNQNQKQEQEQEQEQAPERELQQALRLLVSGEDYPRVARVLSGYLDRHPRGVFAEDALFHLVFVRQHLGQKAEARRLAEAFVVRFPEGERVRRVRMFLKKTKPDNSRDPERRSPTSIEM